MDGSLELPAKELVHHLLDKARKIISESIRAYDVSMCTSVNYVSFLNGKYS